MTGYLYRIDDNTVPEFTAEPTGGVLAKLSVFDGNRLEVFTSAARWRSLLTSATVGGRPGEPATDGEDVDDPVRIQIEAVHGSVTDDDGDTWIAVTVSTGDDPTARTAGTLGAAPDTWQAAADAYPKEAT